MNPSDKPPASPSLSLVRSFVVATPQGLVLECAYCSRRTPAILGAFALGQLIKLAAGFESSHAGCEAKARAQAIGRTFVAQAETAEFLKRVARSTL